MLVPITFFDARIVEAHAAKVIRVQSKPIKLKMRG
jgi:hypothetical protein